MKKLLFILLASFSMNAQTEIRYIDYLGTERKNGYITANQKGEDIRIFNMDSLQALKMVYKSLLETQSSESEISFKYQDALNSIQKCVDLLNHIPIPKTQMKRYRAYIEATKKQGYKEVKKIKYDKPRLHQKSRAISPLHDRRRSL